MSSAHQSSYLEDVQYEVRVAGRFRMGKKVGSGSFGEIFLALDSQTNKEVAVKFVYNQVKITNFQESTRVRRPQLVEEAKLLKDFTGFPIFYWFGKENDHYIMAIELLGPSLEDLFVYCGRKLSLKTVLLIADQLIARLETFHVKGFIHRDLKPENIMIGLDDNASTLYLIDFGLAKRYQNPLTNEHIPYRDKKSLTGTARYASANTHLGIEQSRRDDLEGIGYVLLYLLKGELPWQGLRARNKDEKYRKIKECKVGTPIEQLCQGYPEEFTQYMTYCRQLKFDETLNYDYARRLFKELYYKCGFENEFIFDWTIQRYKVDRPSPSSNEEEKQGNKTSTLPESLRNQITSFDGQDERAIGIWQQNALTQFENEDEQRIKAVQENQPEQRQRVIVEEVENNKAKKQKDKKDKQKKKKGKCFIF